VSINDSFRGVDSDNALDNAVFMAHYPPVISTICIVLMYIAMLSLFLSPIVSVVSGITWAISKFTERSRR
jgi:hypothetical protein